MSEYQAWLAAARAHDGSESVRSQILAATIAHLREVGCDGLFVEDHGFRVFVVNEDRSSRLEGVVVLPAAEWLAEVAPA